MDCGETERAERQRGKVQVSRLSRGDASRVQIDSRRWEKTNFISSPTPSSRKIYQETTTMAPSPWLSNSGSSSSPMLGGSSSSSTSSMTAKAKAYLLSNPIHSGITFLFALSLFATYRQLPRYHVVPRAHFGFIPGGGGGGASRELTLSERLERSEELFQTSRQRRVELTKKFGSDPDSYPNPPPPGPYPAMTWWDFVRLRNSLETESKLPFQ